MFKYVLAENALTLNPDGFVAVVSNSRTRNLDDVVDMMIAEGTGLTRPQAYAYFEKLIQIVEYYIEDGDRVVTPLFCIKPTISGVFNGPNDCGFRQVSLAVHDSCPDNHRCGNRVGHQKEDFEFEESMESIIKYESGIILRLARDFFCRHSKNSPTI